MTNNSAQSQPSPTSVPSPVTKAEPSASAKTLDEHRAEIVAADAALAAVEAEVRREVVAATAEINARYADRLRVARAKRSAAHLAMIVARDAAADHPWTGKRVFQLKTSGPSYSRRIERLEGVVETFRSTTQLPQGTPHYRKPDIGSPIVRLLTKDGKPGKRFQNLTAWPGWKLVEEAAAPTPADTTERPDRTREENQ